NEALALGDRIAILNKGIIQQIGTPAEVYYNPANIFVAESLGDPPMNFLSGTLIDNNRVLFHTGMNGDCFIPVHPQNMNKVKPFVGKEIVLGIRPQQVITFNTPEREYCLKGKVFVHEVLGDEGILSVSIGENLFMVLTKPDITF
ncbi:MAG: sugar ABC transporter ATP-binding protein, partial [Patescibacteria group bacterium]|nr:sugar ABC transporter ATP-binding protein [Patescibacteria group bacterium]